jgi:dTDP-4-amino-4,6-dideoxygalactose transaminase
MDAINNKRSVTVEGYNYKPCEFQSALVFAQLSHCEKILHKRISKTKYICKLFKNKFKLQTFSNQENAVVDKICLIFNTKEERKKAEIFGRELGLFRYLTKPLYREPLFSDYRLNYTHPMSEFFCVHHLVLQITHYSNIKEDENKIDIFIKALRRNFGL